MSEKKRGMADLELQIGVLENENKMLKRQLEMQQVCQDCEELRTKCDYLSEKCKQYIGKASLLNDSKREISKLRDQLASLESQIAEKDFICSNLHINRCEDIIPQRNGSPSSPSIAGEESLPNEASNTDPKRIKEESDNMSLYEQCRVAVELNKMDEQEVVESDSKDAEDNSEDCSEDQETPVCKWMLSGEGHETEICGKVCVSIADLASHFNQSHNGVRSPDGYVCLWEGCKRNGLPLKRKAWFETHFRLHSREKPFKCPYEGCDKRYGDRSSLREHGFKHEPQNFPCMAPECGKVYQSKQIMKQHYREKHEGRPMFKCPVAWCGKMWTCKFKLRRHMKVHEGSRRRFRRS